MTNQLRESHPKIFKLECSDRKFIKLKISGTPKLCWADQVKSLGEGKSLWKSFETKQILWKSSPQVVELSLFLFPNYFVNTSDGRTRKSRKKAKKTATSNWKSSLPPPPLHSESEQLLLLSAIGVVATVEVSVEEAPDVGQFDSSSCATTTGGGRWAFANRGRSITKWKHNTLVRSRIISTKCAFLVLLFKDLWDAGLNKISLLFSLRCVCVRNFSHPAWGGGIGGACGSFIKGLDPSLPRPNERGE